MSLVNYSSDEEEEEEEEAQEQQPQQQQQPRVSPLVAFNASSASATSSAHASCRFFSPPISRLQNYWILEAGQANPFGAVMEESLKLPDASQLFASFDSVKESTMLTLSGGAVSFKKRSDLNGSAEAPPKKIPKGSMMLLRIVPDTAGGALLPPQLKGRSNIATEDLDKLFTRKPKKTIDSTEQNL